jgi:hypothetical protein
MWNTGGGYKTAGVFNETSGKQNRPACNYAGLFFVLGSCSLIKSLFKIVKLFSLCDSSCCVFFVFLVFLYFFWGHKVHEELHKEHEEAVIQSLSN